MTDKKTIEDNPAKELLFKSILARCYGYSTDAFWRMVHTNRERLGELCKQGYSKLKRTLTPKQFRIICKFFGYPLMPNEIEDHD